MTRDSASTPQTLAVLSRLRGRIRTLFVADGLFSLGFGLSGAIAASFVLDYFLVLPVGVRIVFLVGGTVALAHFALKNVGSWLSRRISEEDVANLVERTHPELRQSLITAIELTRPGSLAAAYVSPALLESVVASVEERIGAVVGRGNLVGRGVHGRGWLTGAGLLVLLGAAFLEPVLSTIWFRRNLLLSDQGWPRRTELELVLPVLPIVVAVGDPLEIAVRAVRGDPKTVVLQTVEGERSERVEVLARTTSGMFRKFHENVSRPFRFTVQGGDAEIGPFDVSVKLRPRIDMQSIRIWCDYPESTRLSPTPAAEPLRHGNLKVPTGTRVRYRMSANVPVRRAFFVYRSPTAEESEAAASGSPVSGAPSGATPASEVWPDPGAQPLELTEGRTFQGEFRVLESGSYYFQCESEDLFRSYRPDRFRVEAVPDRKPTVRIVQPDRITEDLSPAATVEIVVSAADDYGIERGSVSGLFFRDPTSEGTIRSFDLPGLAPAAPEGRSPAGSAEARDPGASVEGRIALRVEELSPPGEPPPGPGSRFQYLALAADSAGNTGESQVHFFDIVDEMELLRRLGDQLMVVRDQLREIVRRQSSARKDLAELEAELAAAGEISGQDAQRLFRHQQDQLTISQALDRGVGDLQRILEKSLRNRVGEEKWRSWVSGIRNDLEQLALGKSRSVEGQLEALRKDAFSAAQELGRLSAIQAAQREVERETDSLVLRLTEFGDMNAVIQMLREVRKRQADLREDTRSRVTGAPLQESEE